MVAHLNHVGQETGGERAAPIIMALTVLNILSEEGLGRITAVTFTSLPSTKHGRSRKIVQPVCSAVAVFVTAPIEEKKRLPCDFVSLNDYLFAFSCVLL